MALTCLVLNYKMMDYNRSRNQLEEDRIDEVLEVIWMLREEGEACTDDVRKRSEDPDVDQVLKMVESERLVFTDSGRLSFSPHGEKRAENVIRRHRLAERLLSEVFEIEEKQLEDHACELEHTHVLSEVVVDSICTFLGHPPTCPHGKAIPRGECCKRFLHDLKPLVVPLTELHIGGDARIVFISSKYHARLDRLSSLGIVPGSILRLHQKQPTYLIKIGETELALDGELAKEIFVKKIYTS